MFSVALIGPDGAGKTTVARVVAESLGDHARYMYMGVNLEASNCISPLSRLVRFARRRLGASHEGVGPRDPDAKRNEVNGWSRRTVRQCRSWLGLFYRVLDEWYRQAVAWTINGGKRVVL